MKLAYARIVSTDVLKLARFYQQITGLTSYGVEDYQVFENAHGSSFAISSQDKMTHHGAGAAVAGANRSMLLDFEVEDVDRERARLGGIVKEFVLEPVNQPWGTRSLMFRDPEGNLINFFARIHAPQVAATAAT